MRKLETNSRFVLIVVVSIVVTSSLFGDDPITQRAPSIAVVDVARILREHMRLQFTLKDVEEERKAHESSTLRQRRDLDAQIEELNAIESHSLEHMLRQQQIEVAVAELEKSNERKQAEFADRRARAYFVAYKEISAAVSDFAVRNKIDLVLNYDSSDKDAEDLEEIMRRLQGEVVYQSRLNITDIILEGPGCRCPSGIQSDGGGNNPPACVHSAVRGCSAAK